ncbi:MAG: hypothetical protein IKY59_01925, partial [Oscillospiraceae bacterium]|nr:hypothetical protein [Oscillospiraceae bacterium]
ITKRVISANGFIFEAIDKYYNGENQYWSTDPNGDKNTSDTEVTLIATDANAAILQYVKFAGILNPTNCKNVGTYTIQAILQIVNPNYTFVKDGENVDSWTYDVSAKILKRKIVVIVGNQSAEYTGFEPTVNQGQGYVTITLEDGTVADFVTLDFFGGEVYVFAGDSFDANARYFVLDNKVYQPVELTQEQFESNRGNVDTEAFIQYYVLQHQDPVETLTLEKASGVNAGQYVLTAMLSTSNNYELVTLSNGTFTITKKLVAVPTLDALIYNAQFQFPTAPENVSFSGESEKNVGTYQLTAALRDKNNYAWEDSSVSDDRVLNWSIDQKTITLVLPDGTQYPYGTSVQDILADLNPSWKNNDGPIGDDADTTYDKLSISYGQNTYPQVGTYNVSVSQGSFNANYQVLVEGGTVEIIKKVLTQQELQAQITAAIKYYTGAPLVLDAADDFMINLFDYNNDTQPVFSVTSVNTNGHVDANGWMNGSTFTYYQQDGKIYVTVTVALADAVKANYELEQGANTFAVEAYIAKAENRWTSGPAVNATTITNIQHSAQSLFAGTNYTVAFYKDEACTEPAGNNLDADTTYYAKFTVDGNNNYSGLETVIIFSGGHVTVIKPVVTLDGNVVTEVTTITYDGQVHTFIVPVSDQYTVTYEPNGDWKNVDTYTVTITLNDQNYIWDDKTSTALEYTLIINKKALTITAESYTITFGDEAPQYMVASNGLVNGETLTGLLGSDLASYISCIYRKNDDADVYPIELLEQIK